MQIITPLAVFRLEKRIFTEIFEHFTYGSTGMWNEISIGIFRTESEKILT